MLVHEAIDVIAGSDVETYGTPVICPFPTARLNRDSFKGAMTDSNNFIQIEYTQADGTKLLMIAVHLSEIVEQATYKYGDIIGYVGNAGMVLPKPTLAHAYQGAHLHLAIQRNGTTDDPGKYFDINSPFRGDDTGAEKDRPAADWVVDKITDLLKAFAPAQA